MGFVGDVVSALGAGKYANWLAGIRSTRRVRFSTPCPFPPLGEEWEEGEEGEDEEDWGGGGEVAPEEEVEEA